MYDVEDLSFRIDASDRLKLTIAVRESRVCSRNVFDKRELNISKYPELYFFANVCSTAGLFHSRYIGLHRNNIYPQYSHCTTAIVP